MNELSPTRLGIGIHPDVPERIYHDDPAPAPSASASILRTLYRQSAEHAREKHPRLNPRWQDSKSTDAKDAGTILARAAARDPGAAIRCSPSIAGAAKTPTSGMKCAPLV